ncbi:MAG: polysaccharide deacetylase family protein [Flavobacteriales bacterium]|nr:polysaccharide deacetylase family protein [Flavobacteriales bacterium]
MQEVDIWIESPSTRARYAVEQVIARLLGITIRWVPNPADLHPEVQPCLAYSENPVRGAFNLRPSGALIDGIKALTNPSISQLGDLPILFPVDGADLPFDPFAAAFFHLARVEEWHALPHDEHGRPLTGALHAAKHGYLHRPVVDEWAIQLAERWRAFDPRVPEPQRSYRQEATIDLDNGFKYLGREPWRSAGAWLRDLSHGCWHDAAERIAVLRGTKPDPFVLDAELLHAIEASSTRLIAFVLAADRGPLDHAVPVEHPRYAAYLQSLAARIEIGLHPSYRSSLSEGLTAHEQARLSTAVGKPIRSSRQHFLRFTTPGTFRTAIALGFQEEHSMGCHDRLGFRAGTCTPYPWYDLEHEQSTELMIHPFAVMDNTLSEKLRLSPDEAVREASLIIETVKRVRGTFTGLWHESFLAPTGERAIWRDAILRIIRNAAP